MFNPWLSSYLPFLMQHWFRTQCVLQSVLSLQLLYYSLGDYLHTFTFVVIVHHLNVVRNIRIFFQVILDLLYASKVVGILVNNFLWGLNSPGMKPVLVQVLVVNVDQKRHAEVRVHGHHALNEGRIDVNSLDNQRFVLFKVAANDILDVRMYLLALQGIPGDVSLEVRQGRICIVSGEHLAALVG